MNMMPMTPGGAVALPKEQSDSMCYHMRGRISSIDMTISNAWGKFKVPGLATLIIMVEYWHKNTDLFYRVMQAVYYNVCLILTVVLKRNTVSFIVCILYMLLLYRIVYTTLKTVLFYRGIQTIFF